MSTLLDTLNAEEQVALLTMLIECMQLPSALELPTPSPSDSEDCSTAGSSPCRVAKKSQKCTTLMVRNVPFSFSQKQLLQVFLGEMTDGSIDFFYLPTDISSKRNLGYAFVNFSSVAAADQFKRSFVGRVLSMGSSGLSITSATVQGLDDNIANVLSNPTVRRIKNPLYMPIFLSKSGEFVNVAPQSRA